MQADSPPPLPGLALPSFPWVNAVTAMVTSSTWAVVYSKQPGWVFVVGPQGAWEEMKMEGFSYCLTMYMIKLTQ